MEEATVDRLRRQLTDRQARLQLALSEGEPPEGELVHLLQRVDAALARLGTDEYARCLVCDGHVEDPDLLRNPLLEYCLCALSAGQQRALESDLGLARRIQAGLLPDPVLRAAGWEARYRYEPAGVVSGDYCDVWTADGDGGPIHFAVGDVSGKGVAASLLMAHLQAAFRSLTGAGIPLAELVGRVNRQLLAADIPTHYATLACGRLDADGSVEMVNAGHCPPVLVRKGRPETLGPTGVPVGLVSDQPFDVHRFRLEEGEGLVLYTDGLTEARRGDGEEYGPARVALAASAGGAGASPADRAAEPDLRRLPDRIRDDLSRFLAGAPVRDDLTILAVERSPAPR